MLNVGQSQCWNNAQCSAPSCANFELEQFSTLEMFSVLDHGQCSAPSWNDFELAQCSVGTEQSSVLEPRSVLSSELHSARLHMHNLPEMGWSSGRWYGCLDEHEEKRCMQQCVSRPRMDEIPSDELMFYITTPKECQ